ncbi:MULTISPECIES: DUF6442 family protein [unclassified Streptococcus]|uniref:DUF6442 family protein n=1 Tax=unclassified Streptococcus TaxID=2608887 RepID=UPI00359CD302
MDKQDILEKSRKDYAVADEMEHHVSLNSGNIASIVGITACSLLFTLEAYFTNRFNFGMLGIYFAMQAAVELMTYKQLKTKNHFINGFLTLSLATLLIVGHLYAIFRG